MSSSHPDFAFLQHLYGQDTLYVIPEPENVEPIPVPVVSRATPSLPPVPVKAEIAPPLAEPIVPQEKPVPSPAVVQEIRWLGEALKGTYLLFEVQEEVFKTLPQHAFLQKVLAAVGLSTNQVKFGNLSSDLVHDVKTIAAKNAAKHILLFGQGLPVANLSRMEFYRMYKFEESRFVLVDSLEDIEKSVELKKKLWDVLQKIFLQQN
ncbi:hypothetical protein [Rufibacter tibetensis]|uniref:Uncharacterized protein n=1 Tax=Rufibacter tibetensis TaxID=512763 RepID=A0A0P0D180_9BACT|nr:hypothetical protein [Rufibacter tibetensis]ALJ00560.1 hypothetical protein DC20_18270 [Rufibacter tibetensis]